MENENKKPLMLKIFLVLQWTLWTLWTLLAVAVVGVLAVVTDKLTAGVADRTFYVGCVSVTAAGVVLCLAMGAVLLVALGRGRNWARWFYVASGALGILGSSGALVALQLMGKDDGTVGCVISNLTSFFFLSLLLLPSVRRWFERQAELSPQRNVILHCVLFWVLTSFFGVVTGGGACAGVIKFVSDMKGNPAQYVRVQELLAEYVSDPMAMCRLGDCYREGYCGVEKDANRAFGYYEKSAAANCPAGLYSLAQCYERGLGAKKNPEKAFENYRKAAERGSVPAMNDLGDCYEKGFGTKADPKKAFDWWSRAAMRGNHARAACKAAICLQKDGNEAKGFRWLRNAANLGDEFACYKLAECYELGCGTQSNAVEAARWYMQGAERGQALCMEKAGDCFAVGYGVDKDIAKARAWYEKAVSQGASMTAARKLESLPVCGK